MSRRGYRAFEDKIVSLLHPGATFNYNINQYTVKKAFKPRVQGNGGEPVTDVLLETTNSTIFKISVKQNNADFFKNKLNKSVMLFLLYWLSL